MLIIFIKKSRAAAVLQSKKEPEADPAANFNHIKLGKSN